MQLRTKSRLIWVATGGLAFWLPWSVVSVAAPDSFWSQIIAPLVGLLCACGVLVARSTSPRWGWALAGIYIVGPTAMLLTASLTGAPPIDGWLEWLFFLAICLFPPMTLWLALLGGAPLVAVIVASVLVFVAWERSAARAERLKALS